MFISERAINYAVPMEKLENLIEGFNRNEHPTRNSQEKLANLALSAKLDEFKVIGDFCIENGSIVVIPSPETWKTKYITNDTARMAGGIMALGGPITAIFGLAIAGAAYAGSAALKKIKPNENISPIAHIFGDEEHPKLTAKYNLKITPHFKMKPRSVYISKRPGRNLFESFLDINIKKLIGINLYIGDMKYEDAFIKGAIFQLTGDHHDKLTKILKASGIDNSLINVSAELGPQAFKD